MSSDTEALLRQFMFVNEDERVALIRSKTVHVDSTLYSSTLLHHAIHSHQHTVVDALIENKVDINQKSGSNGETPLISSFKRGLCRIQKMLLEAKASVALTDSEGNNVLHVSCEHHGDKAETYFAVTQLFSLCPDAVQLLFRANNSGDTPFDLSTTPVPKWKLFIYPMMERRLEDLQILFWAKMEPLLCPLILSHLPTDGLVTIITSYYHCFPLHGPTLQQYIKSQNR